MFPKIYCMSIKQTSNFKLYFSNSGRLGTQAEDGGREQSLEGEAGPRGKRAS